MKRENMVMYKSHFEAIFGDGEEDEQAFTVEQKAEFISGYFAYAFEGIEPKFKGLLRRIFELMRPDIDAMPANCEG